MMAAKQFIFVASASNLLRARATVSIGTLSRCAGALSPEYRARGLTTLTESSPGRCYGSLASQCSRLSTSTAVGNWSRGAQNACSPPQYSGSLATQCRHLSTSIAAGTSGRISRLSGGEALEKSYLSVGGERPLLGMTIGQAVDRAASLYGDREAVVSVHQGIRKTFTDLHKDSSGVAAGLLSLGLQPGDRVGIWSPNCYEWVVSQFAAAKAGLVLVNINPSYLADELQYCLNKVSVKTIICATAFKNTQYYSMLCEVIPGLAETNAMAGLNCAKIPSLKSVIMMGENKYSGTLRFHDLPGLATSEHRSQLDFLANKIQFDDACNIQFTSGTTGLPKGAVLSHHNIVNNAYFLGLRARYHEMAHRICVSVPLYHCFGCVAGSVSGVLFGATCVLPAEGFSGSACVEALYTEQITSLYGTPTMFVDILSAARKRSDTTASLTSTVQSPTPASLTPPPALFTGMMAGAPCPSDLVNDVITHLNMKDFLVLYGMTETSPVTFQCYPDDPAQIRTSTIGFPSDHTEVKVVNSDGEIVAAGEEGELCIRGYCVFLGYWEDEAKTEEVLGPDRWFKTGDLASLDSHGYGSIRGRKKDLIIRGGENIYPAELENLFLACPGVKEAQVFGVPDKRLGEEVAVWLRLSDGHNLSGEQFTSWCKGKMASYKIPRHVLVKDTFPVTVTGKIQKFKMRDATVRELNL